MTAVNTAHKPANGIARNCARTKDATAATVTLRHSRNCGLCSRTLASSHFQAVATRLIRNSVKHHAPDALALMHQVEPLVDGRERHGMRDHRVDLDLAVHVPVDDFRHVGAAPCTAEG